MILQGAAGGFAGSLTDVVGTRAGYAATDIRYEGTIVGDAVQVGTGTLLGTAFGGGAQLQQALRGGAGGAGRLNLAQGDPISPGLEGIPPQPGFYDVLAHGNPNIVVNSSSGARLNATDLAKLLSQSKNYNGQNLRLLSCQCGKGVNSLGSQLARRTFVVVKAPNQKLWVNPQQPGPFSIQGGNASPGLPIGGWNTFSPFNLYLPLNLNPDEQR